MQDNNQPAGKRPLGRQRRYDDFIETSLRKRFCNKENMGQIRVVCSGTGNVEIQNDTKKWELLKNPTKIE